MMNTYNNGTCALQFPSSYVLMDAEEMEYVEGGATYKCVINSRTCNAIGISLAAGAAASQLLNLIPGGGTVAALVASVAMGLGSAYWLMAGNYYGMNLTIVTAGKVPLLNACSIRFKP